VILITGASGNAGGAVLEAALGGRLDVRAMVRDRKDAARIPAGVGVAIADFGDRQSLNRALDGIELVFLACGPIPQLIDLESNMIAACRDAGVQHVVLNSALGAGRFAKSFPGWHFQVEAKLQASEIGYTILRPNGFMQNIVTYNSATIRSDNAFYAAMGEARISLIDVRDVGAVAAAILADPAPHRGAIYELNGPEALSNADIASRLTAVAARVISFVDIPEAAHRQAMLGAGMPVWQVDAILELQAYYRSGACAAVDGVVATLLGRPERRIDAYLNENRSAFGADAKPAGETGHD
jgi:uncharacterized protein YbjT (DUF2867 family)